jgi:hypothetical protein
MLRRQRLKGLIHSDDDKTPRDHKLLEWPTILTPGEIHATRNFHAKLE